YQYDGDGHEPGSNCVGSRLKLWEVATGRGLRTFADDDATINVVAFSPDGRLALSGSDDKLSLWDVTTGKEIKAFTGSRARQVAFSPDARTALSGYGATMKLWDVAAGQEIRTLAGHMLSIESVTFSPDGRYIMSGGCTDNYDSAHCKGSIDLWNASTGRELH